MSNSTELAQTGLQKETVNTRCTICRTKDANKREAINRALAKGISHKDIEALSGTASRTIGNHAAHLPAIYQEAKQKGILSQEINVEAEFREQLAFAKDLRTAARDYLSDPETGGITLIPRMSEVSVIYEDGADRDNSGNPKRKRDTLGNLIERLERNNTMICAANHRQTR